MLLLWAASAWWKLPSCFHTHAWSLQTQAGLIRSLSWTGAQTQSSDSSEHHADCFKCQIRYESRVLVNLPTQVGCRDLEFEISEMSNLSILNVTAPIRILRGERVGEKRSGLSCDKNRNLRFLIRIGHFTWNEQPRKALKAFLYSQWTWLNFS